ncbi:hypothetical protein ACFQE8_04060 [Salinirubellus sp. GCM10025818]|uniref:hypothetical protein n=1 Tax=Salinirubellus TaxID=2162630 RepID=UPI0030CF7F0A
MWLIEEYGLDITCTRVEAYEHRDRVLLNSQQVIPIAEAEEYMTKRREKDAEQEARGEYQTTLDILREEGLVEAEEKVYFDPEKIPASAPQEWDEDDEFWWATVTGKTGQRNNVRWEHAETEYSFTGLSKELLHRLVDRDKEEALNGYDYWCHPYYGGQTLYDLRSADVTSSDRTETPIKTPPE